MFENFFANAVSWLPLLLRGLVITVIASVVSMVIGTIWGLLLGLARQRGIPVFAQFVVVYVEVFRGLPTVLILFILYFGLPTVGLTISANPVVVGIIGLSLGLGAYVSEVFRAAINAIDIGQMEAAKSLGMSTVQAHVHIVLPQALLVATPSLGSFFIGLIKDTSLLSFISVEDLLKEGSDIVSATFLSFQVYAIIGAFYIAMSILASRFVILVERRLTPLETLAARTPAILEPAETGRLISAVEESR